MIGKFLEHCYHLDISKNLQSYLVDQILSTTTKNTEEILFVFVIRQFMNSVNVLFNVHVHLVSWNLGSHSLKIRVTRPNCIYGFEVKWINRKNAADDILPKSFASDNDDWLYLILLEKHK